MSKKGIIAIVVGLVIISSGVGIYLYATRPVDIDKVSPLELVKPQIVENVKSDTPDTTAAVANGNLVQYAFTQNTEVSFTIDEVLRGSPFTVVGATKDVSGSIFLNVVDLTASTLGPVLIDARTFHTGSPQRDGAIGRFILNVEKSGNEQIRFSPTSITGMPKTIPPGTSPLELTIAGDLTIAGATKQVTFKASSVNVTSDRISGMAQATVRRSDFGLQIPNIPFVANVPDEFSLKINLEAVATQK